eukprot:scaffold9964_cov111-Isochrysis_galbana.AAC.2
MPFDLVQEKAVRLCPQLAERRVLLPAEGSRQLGLHRDELVDVLDRVGRHLAEGLFQNLAEGAQRLHMVVPDRFEGRLDARAALPHAQDELLQAALRLAEVLAARVIGRAEHDVPRQLGRLDGNLADRADGGDWAGCHVSGEGAAEHGGLAGVDGRAVAAADRARRRGRAEEGRPGRRRAEATALQTGRRVDDVGMLEGGRARRRHRDRDGRGRRPPFRRLAENRFAPQLRSGRILWRAVDRSRLAERAHQLTAG